MTNQGKTKDNALFTYTGKPRFVQIIPIALQHVMAMFVGTVTVPMVVANACGSTPEERQILIQMALIMAGLATLVQMIPRIWIKDSNHFQCRIYICSDINSDRSKIRIIRCIWRTDYSGYRNTYYGICD